MVNPDLKPTLSLGYIPPQQRAVIKNCVQINASQAENGGIHMAVSENSPHSSLQFESLQVNSLPDCNGLPGQIPQDLVNAGVSESSHQNSKESPRHSRNSRDVTTQAIGYNLVCDSQRMPKRKKNESVLDAPNTQIRDVGFRPVSSLPTRNSSPISPHHISQNQSQHSVPQSLPVSFSHSPFDNSRNDGLLSSLANDRNTHQTSHKKPCLEVNQSSDAVSRRLAVRAWGNRPLSAVDPYLWDIMEKEKSRQWRGIELIASENFTSQAVMEALGSHLTNKYSEGLPGSRYYGGNEYIDQIESLCISRALTAFHLDPEKWGVNVQPYSCTSANFEVFTALLQPKDRIMGLDIPSGGHVSHGYYTVSGKKVSGASIFFESLPFKVNPESGLVDFEKLEDLALHYRPKILICGGSAYPREWDYARFRDIANKCQAVLMCDMAHISGIIATQECQSPFDYCDIVTSTTHKSLRGPRGGMIFYRKGLKGRKNGVSVSSVGDTGSYDFEDKINFAVHPSLQGGPHNNHIAALAVALLQVATAEYKSYIQQVKKNSQSLAAALQKRGCKLVTGGTDNHLLLWDLRPMSLTGNRFEKVCEMCHMTVNKNAIVGDSCASTPGGVRIGTPAMTSRGCVEADFEIIADFLLKAAHIAEKVQIEHGKLQKDFMKGLQNNKDIENLKVNIEKFATAFEMPGFETSPMNCRQ